MVVHPAAPIDSRVLLSLQASILAGVLLARPVNCLMSTFGVLLGAWAVSLQVPVPRLILGMLCAALITAGGNSLNDYFDAESDRHNHPRRPIPSGKIARRTALHLSWMEMAAGVIAGFFIGVPSGGIIVAAVALLLAYDVAGLKNSGLPGNILVGLFTALLFMLGGVLAGNAAPPAILAALAFLATLGREIIKDIEDIGGDMLRRTWPMRVGPHRAKISATLILGLAVLLSPLPYLLGVLSFWYLPIVALADLVFLAALVFLFRSMKNVSRIAKLAMAGVLVAMLAGLWK
jgi:geranylgeranylglycerol-phosphate geranylgeranyltransferase